MAISKKGKRKIVVNGKAYRWWVFEEHDQTAFDGRQIKIVSEDQTVYLKYGLQQLPEKRKVVLAFHNDAGLVHVRCPKFENNEGMILPSQISSLIQWCSVESVDRPEAIEGSRRGRSLHDDEAFLLYKEIVVAISHKSDSLAS